MYDPSTLFIPLLRRGRNVERTMNFVSGTRTRLYHMIVLQQLFGLFVSVII